MGAGGGSQPMLRVSAHCAASLLRSRLCSLQQQNEDLNVLLAQLIKLLVRGVLLQWSEVAAGAPAANGAQSVCTTLVLHFLPHCRSVSSPPRPQPHPSPPPRPSPNASTCGAGKFPIAKLYGQ